MRWRGSAVAAFAALTASTAITSAASTTLAAITSATLTALAAFTALAALTRSHFHADPSLSCALSRQGLLLALFLLCQLLAFKDRISDT